MHVLVIGGTKGGVGKTTVVANLGGIAADAGLRVVMLDLDIQPTLSSYFKLEWRAPCGIYELLAFNESRLDELICHTRIRHLDLVLAGGDRQCAGDGAGQRGGVSAVPGTAGAGQPRA